MVDSGRCESVVRSTQSGSVHCLPSMPLCLARYCLAANAVNVRDATEQLPHLVTCEKRKGITASPQMRRFPTAPSQRLASARRFVRFGRMTKLRMLPSIRPFETFSIEPCRLDPGWTGRCGGPPRDSPAIDIFFRHSIANLPSIATFPRIFSSTGSVPGPVRAPSQTRISPLVSSVSRRGRPPSGSWRPKLGGARPEHVDTIAITSTWIARLLGAPTGQDGACESLRWTIWKVDGTWMGRDGADGREGRRRRRTSARKGTTVVGKRLGGEPTRRGRPDGTFTCQAKRWGWSLHGLDRTGWVHAKKQTRFAIRRTNADGT